MSNNQQHFDEAPIGAFAAFGIGPGSANVAAQVPTLRSVQVGGRVPALIRPPTGGFGKLAPKGISPIMSRVPRCISKGSVGVKQEWNGCVASNKWEVKQDDLEPVPVDFPLERTHRCIDGVDASVVAARISDALRVNSIEAEFTSKPPKAKCKTPEFVCFRIRLYAGTESGDPVVVELQRRKGSSSCFIQACRTILSAAEGRVVEEQSPSGTPGLAKMPPLSQMKCLQSVYETRNNQEVEAQLGLYDAKAMLRSQKLDSNVLGLENLVCLTDPIKSSAAVALHVSKAIALGLGGEDIREEILAVTERDTFASVAVNDFVTANHNEMLRHLALTIFANAMTLCEMNGCLLRTSSSESWFREYLVPTLMDEIKRAETNACNATQAAMCLYSYAHSSESAKSYLVEQGILEILQKAHGFGSERNLLLANETDRCLKDLREMVTASE